MSLGCPVSQAQIRTGPGTGSPVVNSPESSSPSSVSLENLRTIQQTPTVPPVFTGSVPAGNASGAVIQLSLKDAIDEALKQNLGLLAGNQNVRSAEGVRLRTLSNLLPNISAQVEESVQQINLAAFGLPRLPGTPAIVGPFGLSDARAFLSQPVIDLTALNNERAASLNTSAAQFSTADAREIVVLVVANLYLQTVATAARVDAAQAQLATATAFYKQAVNLRNAGIVAGIDVLRAQVERGARQQRVLFLANEFSKQKLDLARAIGLPIGQQYELADKMPYAPAPVLNLQAALFHAYQQRADLKRASALVRSAESARKAAVDEALPSLRIDGNYGDIGRTFGHSHGTFTAAAALRIPIFQGEKIKGDITQADALLQQRKAEFEDLRGQIDAEVRKAFFDLQAAADQVEVTRQELDLSNQALGQAKDRFSAGVADNLEVVQAQETVANSNESYISSVYAHNIAKASLARSVGSAEKSIKEFLGEKP